MKNIIITIITTIITVLTLLFISIKITNNDFITFNNIGQISLSNPNKLEIDTFIDKDFVVNSGNDIIINAGNEKIELRVGNLNKITITRNRIDINTNNLFINGIKYNK